MVLATSKRSKPQPEGASRTRRLVRLASYSSPPQRCSTNSVDARARKRRVALSYQMWNWLPRRKREGGGSKVGGVKRAWGCIQNALPHHRVCLDSLSLSVGSHVSVLSSALPGRPPACSLGLAPKQAPHAHASIHRAVIIASPTPHLFRSCCLAAPSHMCLHFPSESQPFSFACTCLLLVPLDSGSCCSVSAAPSSSLSPLHHCGLLRDLQNCRHMRSVGLQAPACAPSTASILPYPHHHERC